VFKFFPAIILIQLITAMMVMTALNWSADYQLLAVIALFAVIVAVLAAFWIAHIALEMVRDERQKIYQQHAQEREQMLVTAEQEKADIVAEKSQLQQNHAREREQILLDAERAKAAMVEENYQKMEEAVRKAHSKANLKVGAAFALTAAAGGVMLFSQLLTVGIMVLVASSSGLAGYLARARHERLSRYRQLYLQQQGQSVDPKPVALLFGRKKNS
jgi:ABC-type multidrug transport system fused ATPase/permease subunit